MPEVRNYEPHIALAGGEDGLDLVRPLIVAAWTSLNMEGALMIEVGWKQTESVAQLFREVGFQEVRIRKDYGGNPRVVMGIRRS